MDGTLSKPKTGTMKKYLTLSFLLMLLMTATSCEVVGDIFKAGMGVGIFIVIAVIVLIVWIISRFKK
jgi:hypothetical protein